MVVFRSGSQATLFGLAMKSIIHSGNTKVEREQHETGEDLETSWNGKEVGVYFCIGCG